MSKDDELDKQLEEILERLEVRTYLAVKVNPDKKLGQIPRLLGFRDMDKQAILANYRHIDEIRGAIGENEEDDLNPFGMMARSTGRNTLRAELRQALNIGEQTNETNQD